MSNQEKINSAAKAFGVSPEKLARAINNIISRKRCYNTRSFEVLFTPKNRRLLSKTKSTSCTTYKRPRAN